MKQQTVLLVSDNQNFISALSLILNNNNKIIHINPFTSDIHKCSQFFAEKELLTLINISKTSHDLRNDIANFLNKLKSISTHYFIINDSIASDTDVLKFINKGSFLSESFNYKKDDDESMPDYINELSKYDLTKRETEVLKCLIRGYSYKGISETLFVSIDTVRTHIRNIYIKLDVNSKYEAVSRVMNICY